VFRMGPGFSARSRVCVGLAMAVTCATVAARGGHDLSTRTTGGAFQYELVTGDSVASLGSRYGIDPREIAAANGLKPGQAVPPGRTLQLDNRHIVPLVGDDVALAINVPQRMLFLIDGDAIAGYPVALGRSDWPTPLGEFTVIAKEESPTWDVPTSIQAEMRREGRPVLQQVPPGPANPLGAFWLGLSLGSVGVHGTNAPLSIFRHATHGCVRLHADDIANLYPRVFLGTRGRVVYEAVLLARTADGIFLEAHPDVYRRTRGDPLSSVREMAAVAGISGEIDWPEVGRVLHARSGIARAVGCTR
jgi:L,D-transpeptidase ErfK/SrfK